MTPDELREAVRGAIGDACLEYLGRDIGTIHADDIVDAALKVIREALPGPADERMHPSYQSGHGSALLAVRTLLGEGR